jgi:hypothetical protein
MSESRYPPIKGFTEFDFLLNPYTGLKRKTLPFLLCVFAPLREIIVRIRIYRIKGLTGFCVKFDFLGCENFWMLPEL